MEYREFTIPALESKTSDWPERKLALFGDVQCGVPACDVDGARYHIDYCLKQKCYFHDLADSVDMANPTDRKRVKNADLNDTTTQALTEKAHRDIEEYLGIVDGTKGLWTVKHGGHHYMDFPDGSTSDSVIAKAIGAEYVGDVCSTRINLVDKHGTKLTTVSILSAHGKGTSSAEPGALSAVMRWGINFDHHDVVAWGHHHKKIASKKPRPYFDENGLMKHRNTTWCVNGAWLKGYMQGHQVGCLPGGNYVEKALYSPVALGGLILTLRAKPDGTPHVSVSV